MVEKTEFIEEAIKEEVKKHYGINISKIEIINGGSANIYKLTSDKGNKYILKEFQSKFSDKTILKEVNVINHLKNKGISVPEYVNCIDGRQFFKYNDKTVIMQKFIEGKTRGNYSGSKEEILQSARYLGIIVNALEDYPYNDMFECNISKFTSDDTIDKAIEKHKNLIPLAKENDEYGKDIIKDMKDKIAMLEEVKKDGTFKEATNLTIKKTHGDFNVLQFIYEKGKIKAVIDFVSAGELPIVWEIARSYNYIDKACKNGVFDIDNLVMYVKEYLKYSTLNKDDLKYLPYVYLVQVLSSTYGYKEYLENGNKNLLKFGKERTNICRYLMDNAKIISNELLKINPNLYDDEYFILKANLSKQKSFFKKRGKLDY